MSAPMESVDESPEAGLATSLLDEGPDANATGDDAATDGAGPLSHLPFPPLVLVALPGLALSVAALSVCGFVVAEFSKPGPWYSRNPLEDYRFGLFVSGAANDHCSAYTGFSYNGAVALGSAQHLGRTAGALAVLLSCVATAGTIHVSLLADRGTKWFPKSGVLYVAAAACQAATFVFLYGLTPCDTAHGGRVDGGGACRADFGPGAILAVISGVLHAILGSCLL